MKEQEHNEKIKAVLHHRGSQRGGYNVTYEIIFPHYVKYRDFPERLSIGVGTDAYDWKGEYWGKGSTTYLNSNYEVEPEALGFKELKDQKILDELGKTDNYMSKGEQKYTMHFGSKEDALEWAKEHNVETVTPQKIRLLIIKHWKDNSGQELTLREIFGGTKAMTEDRKAYLSLLEAQRHLYLGEEGKPLEHLTATEGIERLAKESSRLGDLRYNRTITEGTYTLLSEQIRQVIRVLKKHRRGSPS